MEIRVQGSDRRKEWQKDMSPPLPGKDGSHNGLLNKQQQKDAETNKKRHPTLKDKEESETAEGVQ